ncbi:MAG: (deoxy)nucleoside triphosphate pyrophosphohydrolase [Marmoricola sp.]
MREVVGVAVLEADRVLAARRAFPSPLAGLWELPGGKVEPGEDPSVTAVREIAEELGCGIEVTGWLEGESVIPASTDAGALSLRVATARLAEGDPVPEEHDAVRWLRVDELDTVTWAEADVPFLTGVRALLEAR